jgi:hypothetical protein
LYLCLYELRCGDQTDAGAALDPHLSIGVETGVPRAAPTPTEEGAERIGISVLVAGPIFDACVDHVELKGEDVFEDVRARRRWGDRVERAEQVGRFGRGLVEEAETGERGEAERP